MVGAPAQRGLFRLGPKQAWMPCEVWQYDTCLDVARIFLMRLRLRGVLPMLVRDTYVRGEGRMRGRVLDAFSVVDQSDEKIAIGGASRSGLSRSRG